MKKNEYKELFKKLQTNKLIPLDIDLLDDEELDLLEEQSKIFYGLRVSNTIYLKIKFHENNLIPYDVKILNNSEKNKLKKDIEDQLFIFNIEYENLILINTQYKILEIKIKEKLSEIDKQIYLLEEINKVYNDYQKMLNHYNEENKSIFERSLLKNQLADF